MYACIYENLISKGLLLRSKQKIEFYLVIKKQKEHTKRPEYNCHELNIIY